MGKVFVVQEPKNGIDVSSAAKYGEFEVLLPPGDVVLSTEPAIDKLRRKLKGFSDDDHLLLLGDPVAIGLATKIAADQNRDVVRMLRWARQSYFYVPVTADFRPPRLRQ